MNPDLRKDYPGKLIARRTLLTGLLAFPAVLGWGGEQRSAHSAETKSAAVKAGERDTRVRLVEFDDSGERKGIVMAEKVVKTD